MAKIADKNPELKFAYAGRSKEKLEKTLEMARTNTKLELKDVPLIVADVSDEETLVTMAQQAKVVINCVGPVSPFLPLSWIFFLLLVFLFIVFYLVV